VTGKRGTPWVTNNLNASHLDYYYALLAVLAAANLSVFLALSGRYTYRAESRETIGVAMDVQGGLAKPEPVA
jgi:peptide/histidine transporter 3/4